MSREGARGQIAVVFVVLLGAMLIMASMMMNAGEIAAMRTSTSNAADAGALTGASWVASGENEMMDIGDTMLDNVFLIQRIYATPFCPSPNITTEQIRTFYEVMLTANKLLASIANQTIMEQAWRQALAYAYFTALSHTIIDDPSGGVEGLIQQEAEAFNTAQTLPDAINAPAFYSWDRGGAGGATTGHSTLAVHVTSLGPMPQLSLQEWRPFAKQWQSPQGDFTGNRVGWTAVTGPSLIGGDSLVHAEYEKLRKAGPGNVRQFEGPPYERKLWGRLHFDTTDIFDGPPAPGSADNVGVDALPIPKAGFCDVLCVPRDLLPASSCPDNSKPGDGQCCFPGEVSVTSSWGDLKVIPVLEPARANGNVSVEVIHSREGGTPLAFWTTQYPAGISSKATARYEGAGLTSTGAGSTAARAFLTDAN